LVRTQQRGVPPWLDRVIARGLRPQPADRHGAIEALLDAMVLDRRRRRRGLVALAVAIPLVSAAAVAGAWMLRPEPVASAPDRTRTLVDEARTAAAHGQYVHPSPGAPDEPTAIAKVLELEALGDDDATAQAAALRSELADALVSLGDRYFERPGGPPFAVDFYAAALVFDPRREHSRARVTLSPGQLAELVAKAEHGGFTSAELVAAEPLALLAEADPQRRAQKVERYFASRDDAAESTRARLDGLLDAADRELARAASTRTIIATKLAKEEPARTSAPASPPTDATPTIVEDAKAPREDAPRESGDGARDPAGAAREAAAGTQALRSGQLGVASSAFHRALQLDRRNAAALGGLAELHFERSEYRDAERFAARATAVTPRASALWILLGDARVKLLRYDDARAAYDKANALGASSAASRIARLDRLVGK
ncbi:MAG TPA: tetratricopeptide repeat protein, partial [Nannocystaceae bacterium]|nr:tetratricopeptide repeat protein [Nannocystaceae bacterium]